VGFLASSADSSGSNVGLSNVGFLKQLSVPVFTAHSVSCCFYVHGPRSPMHSLCPLSTHSHAVSFSTVHSVSCCFYVHSPRSPMQSLCPLSTHSHAVSISTAHSKSHAVSMSTAHSVSRFFFVHYPLSLVLFLSTAHSVWCCF
jgi:hypothetical protein